jgi:hypothetical protein
MVLFYCEPYLSIFFIDDDPYLFDVDIFCSPVVFFDQNIFELAPDFFLHWGSVDVTIKKCTFKFEIVNIIKKHDGFHVFYFIFLDSIFLSILSSIFCN